MLDSPNAGVREWMDVDFHGKTWPEARAAFLDAYQAAVKSGVVARSLHVVHGYGASGVGGVLRERFRKYLNRYEGRLEFKPGEAIDGNQGWTLVQAISLLPDEDEDLEDLISEYCQQPRTLDKIAGRFRRYGDRKVGEAVESLLKAPPLLRKIRKGKQYLYEAI